MTAREDSVEAVRRDVSAVATLMILQPLASLARAARLEKPAPVAQQTPPAAIERQVPRADSGALVAAVGTGAPGSGSPWLGPARATTGAS